MRYSAATGSTDGITACNQRQNYFEADTFNYLCPLILPKKISSGTY